jgi:hypothetical protein
MMAAPCRHGEPICRLRDAPQAGSKWLGLRLWQYTKTDREVLAGLSCPLAEMREPRSNDGIVRSKLFTCIRVRILINFELSRFLSLPALSY